MPRHSAAWLIVIWASVAVAQPAVDTDDAASTGEGDGVDELVRELRELRARRPATDPSIDVYSTHYMIGSERFDSLDDLLQHIKGYPPGRPMVRLVECSALARAEELLTEKAKLEQAYIERLRDAGHTGNLLFEAMTGWPPGCPLFENKPVREAEH